MGLALRMTPCSAARRRFASVRERMIRPVSSRISRDFRAARAMHRPAQHRSIGAIPMATEVVILGVTVCSYLLCALFLRVCDRI